VRRVGDELPLGLRRVLERGEHGVERGREARELVTALVDDPAREIAGLGHVLGRTGQSLHRCEHRSRDEQPEPGGESDAHEGDSEQVAADPPERAVDLLQRPRDLERVALADRDREHAHVGALDVCVVVERFVDAACGGLDRIVRHGQRGRGSRRRDRLAVPADELREHGGAAEPLGRDAEEPLALRVAEDSEPRERRRPRPERLVDLAAELVSHEHVGDRGRGDDGDRDGCCCSERQAGAEAHCSRRA
jgi:hypothetical protein